MPSTILELDDSAQSMRKTAEGLAHGSTLVKLDWERAQGLKTPTQTGSHARSTREIMRESGEGEMEDRGGRRERQRIPPSCRAPAGKASEGGN